MNSILLPLLLAQAAGFGYCPAGQVVQSIPRNAPPVCVAASSGGGAPTSATYVTQTPDATLSAEQAMSGLGTGLVSNTTGTGVLSIYGGATCTAPNFVRVLSAAGAPTCAAPAPVTTSVLVGNGAGGIADFSGSSCGIDTYAQGVNINGTLNCNSVVNVTGNAATATALAADPSDCTGNNFALGVNASGTAACAQPTFNNLSGSASITQGGTTETASTEDAVLVGASTTDWVATVLPSCSNATTSKLLYDNTTNAFSCGTDQTGGGGGVGTMTRLTATWTSSAVANTLGIIGTGGVPMTSPSYGAGAPFSATCHIVMTRPSTTNGPRYGVQSSGTVTAITLAGHIGLAGTAPVRTQNIVKLLGLATGTCTTNCTAAITASTLAQAMVDTFEFAGVMNTAGTVSLVMAPSAAAAHTAQIGSYCIWY